MTNAKNNFERNKILENKFAIDIDKVPYSNIILYDDAVNSGMTIDKVVELIKGIHSDIQIFVIVQTVYKPSETEVLK